MHTHVIRYTNLHIPFLIEDVLVLPQVPSIKAPCLFVQLDDIPGECLRPKDGDTKKAVPDTRPNAKDKLQEIPVSLPERVTCIVAR